jgi:hypothetical protein
VKDVLHHWSAETIHKFLPTLKRYPLALITNNTNPREEGFLRKIEETKHRDIEEGGGRPLDIRNAPFFVKAEQVYTYGSYKYLRRRILMRKESWRKTVLLVRSEMA